MSYQIQYSPVAVRDLDRVWAEVFAASKTPEIATKYVDDLMNHILGKKEFPKSSSPLYYEGTFTGYYFIVFKAYMAFYHVQEDEIWIDRILYGKSDYIRTIFRNLDR